MVAGRLQIVDFKTRQNFGEAQGGSRMNSVGCWQSGCREQLGMNGIPQARTVSTRLPLPTTHPQKGIGRPKPADSSPMINTFQGSVTRITRPVKISVTYTLPLLTSFAMLVGVIKQSAITDGVAVRLAKSFNLPGNGCG
jgi:hypothetical protein